MIKLIEGDKVQWASAAGVLTGTIKSIKPGLNGKRQMIDWIIVSRTVPSRATGLPMEATSRMAYTPSNMAMMKVRVVESVGFSKPDAPQPKLTAKQIMGRW